MKLAFTLSLRLEVTQCSWCPAAHAVSLAILTSEVLQRLTLLVRSMVDVDDDILARVHQASVIQIAHEVHNPITVAQEHIH